MCAGRRRPWTRRVDDARRGFMVKKIHISVKKPAPSAKATIEELEREVRRRFDTGGMEEVISYVVTKVTTADARVAQLREELSRGRLGQSRSGSEKGLTLSLFDPPKSEGEAAKEEASSEDSTGPKATSGVSDALLEKQATRGDELNTQIAKLQEERRKLERVECEARRKARLGEDEQGGAKNTRRTLLDDPNLETIEVPYHKSEEEQTCSHCGSERVDLKSEQREWVEYLPGRLVRCVQMQPVTVCSGKCGEAKPSLPVAAPLLLDGGMIGNSVIAHTIVSKFGDHIPLHRQSRMLERTGIEVADTTLAYGYGVGLATLHEMFAQTLCDAVLACDLVQFDPTGFAVLDPKRAPGSTHRGTVTTFVGDRKVVFMEYHPSAAAESVIWRRLKDFSSKVLCDGSNAFDRLFNGLVASAMAFFCNAHARRKFKPLAQSDDPTARWAMKQYAQVYRVETLADERKLVGPERAELRQRYSLPIMDEMRDVFTPMLDKHPPSEPILRPIRYFLKRFEGLTRFIDHGNVPPDNNFSEETLRAARLLENNSLFAGNQRFAAYHATAWALMKSCKLAGINPVTWLTDVLTKYAQGWLKSRVAELLPHNWKQLHAEG